MSWLPESQDRLPLTWWKGQPIYLAAILAIAGVASMIVTTLLMAAADGAIVGRLIFSYANLVDQKWIWTPLTYVLVNPPSLWLVLSCFFFWRFGEQVERHLGRIVFVKLVVGLWVVTPLLLTLLGLIGARSWGAAGMTQLGFGVFIAFATLYPHAKLSLIICSIDAWVLAVILVGVSALVDLAFRNWPGLFVLAGQVFFAYAYIRFEQGHWALPSFSFSSRQPPPPPPLPREDASEMRARRRKLREGFSKDRVDTILEKIHREGLQSLTDEERRIMERASEHLRKGGS